MNEQTDWLTQIPEANNISKSLHGDYKIMFTLSQTVQLQSVYVYFS